MITPHIVRRDSPGVTPNLPGLVEPFLAPPNRTMPMPPPAFGNPMSGQPAGGPARTVVSNTESMAPAAYAPATASSSNTSASSTVERVNSNDDNRRVMDKSLPARSRSARAKPQRSTSPCAKQSDNSADWPSGRERPTQSAGCASAGSRRSVLEDQAAVDRKRWLEQQ